MKFLDKNIKRKSKIVSDTLQFARGSKIPLPSVVEISDSGTCNRACIFCPRSDSEWISKFDKKEFITTELHEKICKELSEYNYKGIVVYSGFNDSFRLYFDQEPREIIDKLIKDGSIESKPVKGGIMIYLPGESPKPFKDPSETMKKILD